MISPDTDSKKALRLVVVGSSAGGLETMQKVLPHIPSDFPAAIILVQHLHAEANVQVILRMFRKVTSLECGIAADGEALMPCKLYLPPADHHILVNNGHIKLTRGARENRWRPGIDPLFRSAAVHHGKAVTGLILTGLLDDGTAGMSAINRCGGTLVVQNPDDALFPDMIKNVLLNMEVSHRADADELGALLIKLVTAPLPDTDTPVPPDLITEARIAERITSTVKTLKKLGEISPYTCPDCGGILAEMDKDPVLRFRCHTGHTYSIQTLLHSLSEEQEEAIWVALRVLEERRNLYNQLITRQRNQAGSEQVSRTMEEKAEQTQQYIDRLRELLLTEAELDPLEE